MPVCVQRLRSSSIRFQLFGHTFSYDRLSQSFNQGLNSQVIFKLGNDRVKASYQNMPILPPTGAEFREIEKKNKRKRTVDEIILVLFIKTGWIG